MSDYNVHIFIFEIYSTEYFELFFQILINGNKGKHFQIFSPAHITPETVEEHRFTAQLRD